MAKKFIRSLIIFFLVVLFVGAAAVPALAFDGRTGPSVTVESGEVVNGDLYITATNINIDGTVNGDVFAVGQSINISGTVNGGITLAGQSVTVNGKVFTGARIAGQTVTIGGNIGRDLLVAASTLDIKQAAVIGGDLVSGSTLTTINGHITGSIKGTYSQASLSGTIDHDVNLKVNNLTLTPAARVGGNLTYISENKANIQPGAIIAGTTSQVLPSAIDEGRRGLSIRANVMLRIIGFLAIFIIGIIFIFTATRKIKMVALSLQSHPVSSLGWGALIFFVTPIAAFIIMFTVIGIPLGLLSLGIWGILLYLSQLPVALLIGWLILSRARETVSQGFLVGALALGLFILYLVTAIPVLGWIIWFFVIVFGLGTLVTVIRRTPERRLQDTESRFQGGV